MCYPTGSGETGQVWSWKQRTSSKKGELAWMEAAARLPHHCSNLPLSLASPAGKLSRPGAIWSSPWCLHPSARQLGSSDNHAAGRRTTYSMSKIKWKMTVICDTHRKNSYPRHFWGICPLYHRESFLFFWKGFSQWGSPGGISRDTPCLLNPSGTQGKPQQETAQSAKKTQRSQKLAMSVIHASLWLSNVSELCISLFTG